MNKLPFLLVLLNTIFTLAISYRQILPLYVKNGVPETADIVSSTNNFGFKIIKQIPQTTNALFSPISMTIILSLVYLGTRNDTKKEISRVMGYNSEVHPGYKRILDTMTPEEGKTNTSQSYMLEMANAMLVDKDFNIFPSYKETSRKYYDAAVESVNFATHPDAAVESVNGWVAWKTKNKITTLLQEVFDPLTKLFLMNAVYFRGTWKTRFDQRWTTPDTFYNDGKVPKTVPMMRQKGKLKYGFDNRVQGHILELPYKGDSIKMIILLSEKRDGLPEMESSLTSEILSDISSGLREVTVQVTLPRFELSEEYDMIPLWNELGIHSIFDPDSADLTGISPRKGLYVTKVVHKSVLEVNEEGSEAATVTGLGAGLRTSVPPIPLFTADHPFIFFIRDTRFNLTLFIGRVVNL